MKLIQLRKFHKEKSLNYKQPCVMALGFYDGVHLGHQRIIKTAKEIADKKKLSLAVMTFSPHPREVMGRKEKSGTHLTPLKEKAEKMKQLGVDVLYVVEFDKEFGSLAPARFVEDYLLRLNVKHAVAGFDFTYGYKGLGNMKQLNELGNGFFDVTTISKIECNSQKIGSTLIRELVSEGKVDLVPEYLGDHYKTSGRVNQSSNQGNLIVVHYDRDFILPKSGTYEVSIEVEGRKHQGVCYHQLNDHKASNKAKIQIHDKFEEVFEKSIQIKWIKKLSNSPATRERMLIKQ